MHYAILFNGIVPTNLNAEMVHHQSFKALPLSLECLWFFLQHATYKHPQHILVNTHGRQCIVYPKCEAKYMVTHSLYLEPLHKR